MYKENIIEDLKSRNLNYVTVEEFLSNLKKEFGKKDDKIIKAVELERIEQENKTMEKFVL